MTVKEWNRIHHGKWIELPEEWIKPFRDMDRALKSGRLFFGINIDANLFTEFEAAMLCRMYLKTKDKSEYPTMLGMHPIMDEVLGQEFKK